MISIPKICKQYRGWNDERSPKEVLKNCRVFLFYSEAQYIVTLYILLTTSIYAVIGWE